MIFFNPQTKQLRSGWRVLIFAVLLLSPQLLLSLFQGERRETGSTFEMSLAMIMVYALIVGWVVLVSWGCLHLLEGLKLSSLGFDFGRGWWREIICGCAIAVLMIVAVVLLQWVSGGTQISPNPIYWRAGAFERAGWLMVVKEVLTALVLLILAGTFEELVYRGYPFQTLLRGAPAAVPIFLFALLFGFGHWKNPSRTFFSTANTILAGVWLALAYLKTRRLWFPTALHFTWNWMMGPFFGLPVSGLLIPRHPVFVSTSEAPLWVTGGSYGSEGGAAATLVLLISIMLIWRYNNRN